MKFCAPVGMAGMIYNANKALYRLNQRSLGEIWDGVWNQTDRKIQDDLFLVGGAVCGMVSIVGSFVPALTMVRGLAAVAGKVATAWAC